VLLLRSYVHYWLSFTAPIACWNLQQCNSASSKHSIHGIQLLVLHLVEVVSHLGKLPWASTCDLELGCMAVMCMAVTCMWQAHPPPCLD
jgi:hypothetical protein